MDFESVQKLVTLNDLDRRYDRYLALFHRNQKYLGLLTSQQLKLYSQFCNKMYPKESRFRQCVIYGNSLRDY